MSTSARTQSLRACAQWGSSDRPQAGRPGQHFSLGDLPILHRDRDAELVTDQDWLTPSRDRGHKPRPSTGNTTLASAPLYPRGYFFAIMLEYQNDTLLNKAVCWSHRLTVRTPGFHPGNRSSILREITKRFCEVVFMNITRDTYFIWQSSLNEQKFWQQLVQRPVARK